MAFTLYVYFWTTTFSVDKIFPDNYPEPGKRPLSSTVPTIIENEDSSFYLAAGGSGGSLIFTAFLQVYLHIMNGMNPLEAVEYGRLHDQLYPPITVADSIYPEDLLDALRERGHNVTSEIYILLSEISLCWKDTSNNQ